jgi:hypothetical protein
MENKNKTIPSIFDYARRVIRDEAIEQELEHLGHIIRGECINWDDLK